ncbi:unnamed protein product [Rhizophagus irregularis]|nr:unnamed protein product [Rhizophagus irregularis]
MPASKGSVFERMDSMEVSVSSGTWVWTWKYANMVLQASAWDSDMPIWHPVLLALNFGCWLLGRLQLDFLMLVSVFFFVGWYLAVDQCLGMNWYRLFFNFVLKILTISSFVYFAGLFDFLVSFFRFIQFIRHAIQLETAFHLERTWISTASFWELWTCG